MDADAVRAELTNALDAATSAEQRVRMARELLVKRGIATLQLPPQTQISLDAIIKVAVDAPPSDARREFALAVVYATGIAHVLPTRGEAERRIQSFLERALLNPLRRADYPFDGTQYDKRQALARLHLTIDEHLQPPEPSIPRWIHGVARRTED